MSTPKSQSQDLFSAKYHELQAFEQTFNENVKKHSAIEIGYHSNKRYKPILLNKVKVDPQGNRIRVDRNTHTSVNYDPHQVPYIQDAAISFPVKLPNGNYGMVEVVNDGHGGEACSQWVVREIFQTFQNFLDNSTCVVNQTRTTGMMLQEPYIVPESEDAIDKLFAHIHAESQKPMNRLAIGSSGTTCSVVVYDLTDRIVFAASLGDSPIMKFNMVEKNGDNVYSCTWMSEDQDASSEAEQLRLRKKLTNHLKLADLVPVKHVVYKERDICWRMLSGLMVTAAFGDFYHDTNPMFCSMKNVINRVPNKWILSWEPDTVWIQGSDGMHEHLRCDKIGMGPKPDVTIPLYEALLTQESRNHWPRNVAAEMINIQAKTICEEKSKFTENKTRGEINQWCLANWDNHNQYVRLPVVDLPCPMPMRSMSSPITC